ncbi:tRNA (guanine(6)-N(2))-methyltransferase THUMP3-like isoform X2 [Ptychodera flava]|uniref:tRNA (guanine(6)-N(2))-methyltransferase THUMP3-like isoform X2 n=1 Tax=Ptychodera flava TaxID=63121 RepID=UPI00396A12F2
MAAPTEENVCTSSAQDTDAPLSATIGTTVTTGFENLACQECKEKLGVDGRTGRGRMFFDITINELLKINSLRGVDNMFVIVTNFKDHNFSGEKESDLKSLIDLVTQIDWFTGLEFWKCYSSYERPVAATVEACAKLEPSDQPTFRVTCHRTGTKHSFTSMEAAAQFGGSINDNFKWRVDLSHADIDVLLNIADRDIQIAIALTRESMHRRNITHFGSTTLRATLAYMMLRLGEIQPGDVVCDPMCGTGAIPIEAALNWPSAVHMCGDKYEHPCTHTWKNIAAVNEKRQKKSLLPISADIINWDVRCLPLRTNSVDVIVSDLPFGKRSGSKFNNWELYHKGLTEMARICREESGRAVLLTQDKKCMTKTISLCKDFWKNRRTIWINQGGLQAGVYILQRTKTLLT